MARIENRYTVFKDADLEEAAKAGFLSNHELETIRRVEQAMIAHRQYVQRKSAVQYVVFQSNWPVFKDAKSLLQSYINWESVPKSFNLSMTGAEERRRAHLQGDHTGNPRLSEHG